jgi:hypothetical protein
MALEVKPAKNSKLPKLPENCFEPVGKGGWPPISTWIILHYDQEEGDITYPNKIVTMCVIASSH